MFRAIVKAQNARQASAALEAHGLLDIADRLQRHPSQPTEWIADLVARPDDTWVRSVLNAWLTEGNEPFISGLGFRFGTLLFWSPVDETLPSLQVQARKAIDAMILHTEATPS